MLQIDSHPLLHTAAFTTEFPEPLAQQPSPEWMSELLKLEPDETLNVSRSEEVRTAVRKLLRHGGYRPTGRGKPAPEYLVRAVGENALSSINLAVDACNVVSLNSGLPISVVDSGLALEPLRIGLGQEGDAYEFNASGQTIDLKGLLCLFDKEGPCANAVKDCQRTKTHAETKRTLSVLWGSQALPEGHLQRTLDWYRQLLERAGAVTELVELTILPAAE